MWFNQSLKSSLYTEVEKADKLQMLTNIFRLKQLLYKLIEKVTVQEKL